MPRLVASEYPRGARTRPRNLRAAPAAGPRPVREIPARRAGTLKSKIIPDAQRSTIYNLFRVPLNVLVLLVLLSKLPTQMVFTAAASLLLAAAVLQHLLFGAMKSYRVQAEFDREPLVSV